MTDGKKWYIKHLIPITFYLLIAVFFVLYIRSIDLSKLKDISFNWTYLLIASALGLLFRYWGIFIWFVLLKGLGAKNLNNKVELAYVYAKSWMGRYIPGTAPWILGKIYFASRQGISKNKLAVSSLLEGALQIVVVMLMAFLMLVLDKRFDVIDPKLKLLLSIALVALLISLLPPVFNRLISFAYHLFKKKKLAKEDMANSKLILKGSSMYVIGALLSGLSLFFIAKAVYPSLSFGNILFVMGVSNLAASLSMLAIFAPSGIGVREGIQLVLFSAIMPKEFALLIAVTTRVWTILIDLLFLGLAKANVYFIR